jgi:hypothetical protein
MKRLINLCLFDRKHVFLLEIESMNRILFFLALCPTILIAQVDITHTGGDWGESGQSSATFTANQTSCTIQTGPQTFSYVVSESGNVAISLNGTCAFPGNTSVLLDFDWNGEFLSIPLQFLSSRNSSNGIWAILDSELGTVTKYLMESSRVRVQATPENEYADKWTAVFSLSGSSRSILEVLNKQGVTVDVSEPNQVLRKGMYD